MEVEEVAIRIGGIHFRLRGIVVAVVSRATSPTLRRRQSSNEEKSTGVVTRLGVVETGSLRLADTGELPVTLGMLDHLVLTNLICSTCGLSQR